MAKNASANVVVIATNADKTEVYVSVGISRDVFVEQLTALEITTETPVQIRTYNPDNKAIKAVDLMDKLNEDGMFMAPNASGTGFIVGNVEEILGKDLEPVGGEAFAATEYTLFEAGRDGWYVKGDRADKVAAEEGAAKASGGGGNKLPRTTAQEVTVLGDCIVKINDRGRPSFKQGHDSKTRSAIHKFHDKLVYKPLGRVPVEADFHHTVELAFDDGNTKSINVLFELARVNKGADYEGNGQHETDKLPDIGHTRHEASPEAIKRVEKAAAKVVADAAKAAADAEKSETGDEAATTEAEATAAE